VGKTTIAAALGLAAARAGLDTGVITIDPARRLRDALGIERLSSRPSRLDGRRRRAAGLDPSLRLSAMMLDVKRTWDGLVDQFVSTPAARRRILENSFYRNLTHQFAGAEAYAALAQLYDLHAAARFGLEIVDTPPASHAFEFIEAPAHLARLLDSRGARWLFAAHDAAGRGAARLAGRAARFVIDQLENFAGARMLSSSSDFFSAATEATGAKSERLRKTEALLRSSRASFVLVTTPAEDRVSVAALARQVHEKERATLAAGVELRLVKLAQRFALEKIRVNALCPGLTDTPMLPKFVNRNNDPAVQEENTRKLNAAIPMGRPARPEELAQAALWLLSDDASYVTGVALPVDGGYVCR